MNNPNCDQKPHAVCVPFPAQGHVNPTMLLAKLLHSRGFHITFVNTDFNHRRLIRSGGAEFAKGLPGFSFEAIPDGLPPSDHDATQDIPPLCASVKKNCSAPFKELLLRLKAPRKGWPPVTCVVSDATTSCFAVEAAEALGIPHVQFWTASACSLIGYLQYEELLKRGIVPFKDGNFMHDGTLDKPIDWIPGMKNIRFKDLPSFMRTQSSDDIMFNFLGSAAQNCSRSSAIIFNTFHELEREALQAISARYPSNRFYSIGPLGLLNKHIVPPESRLHSLSSSLWKEDTTCLEWLDEREPNSVVYINYGSITTMTQHSFVEFAWGLAKSERHFLWIVRPDVVVGSDSATLPEEFFEEVKDRGLLAKWCPQERVLSHSSVGAFLTHCGWNSTLDAVCAGVPAICWPFFADQQTNCRYACVNWGIGVELDNDVKRGEVAALVREMMGGEKGKVMKEKALEWKRKAVEATDIGGSSRIDFDKLIMEGFSTYNG